MSCSFDKEIIQKYADNTIDPLELIVLKEHIAVCSDCKFELELMNKLESSMYEYFQDLPDNPMLEEFSMKVLSDCYRQSEKYSYVQGISKVWEINKMVASNASKYTAYLPGSKLAAKTVKKAGGSIQKAAKEYVKSSFKKLIVSAIR